MASRSSALRFVGILTLLGACSGACSGAAADPGLLFYLSGEHEFTADIARGGGPQPTFQRDVSIVPDGAQGRAIQCENTQLLAYKAPGNIFAQRGTLSFFWRSRYPVGPTPFPIFRVGYGDHSSWDMCFLRIDYNGAGHGFDAFVTDANLSRVRVSVPLQKFPGPKQWTHLALAWDETTGIRFYIDGQLAAEKLQPAVLNAALDQFGPHSRIIAPWQVQSDYNFVRGGDIDELRIYDRMLPAENIARLAKGDAEFSSPPLARSVDDPRWRAEWAQRYGFDEPPPYYPGDHLAIRKVEIHDAYDLKRWWYKACDGIPETTWPGVYNRSRLPGRNDYFQLPDWDCYVESGKAITFFMPDEPWNHLEISGSAWGKMELLSPGSEDAPQRLLFERPQHRQKTVHTFDRSITGGHIRFTNVEQEEPIGEIVAYHVGEGREPAGSHTLAYRLSTGPSKDPAVEPIVGFIAGRHPADERATLFATPADSPAAPPPTPSSAPSASSLPIVHLVIPNTWDALSGGLDGIALDLPGIPSSQKLIPLNLQVKDPLWTPRNMLDFTFAVKPNEPRTLWLDLRDRLLPPGKPLYLSVASMGDLTPTLLEGARVRLIFKPREAARPEHELAPSTQAKDSYAMLVEEHPHSPKLNLWNRFSGDLSDLLRINPQHELGRQYAAVGMGAERPPMPLENPPAGVPLWAFRQVELLESVKYFVNWYIDHRQVPFGDLGGGISDDTDLTNTWPGVALMGCDPSKLTASLHRLLEADYRNGMFTRGLPTIQADELHSYEEGINCLGQNLILDFGNPRQLERAMENARGVESITGVNPAGHRHIRTSYYNGTRMAQDYPWDCVKPYSYLVLQPSELLVDYNGSPHTKQVMLELADGLLAHRRPGPDGGYVLPDAIHFESDKEDGATRGYFPWHLFWTAWQWTGDRKYLEPIFDGGTRNLSAINADALDLLDLRQQWSERNASTPGAPANLRRLATRFSSAMHTQWQLTGDKKILEELYTAELQENRLYQYINTEGSLWIDRVMVHYADLQRARLGGIALVRNGVFPGHVVSWNIHAPARETDLAVLIPSATRTRFKVIAYNLDTRPLTATMTGWNIDPGQWEITQGVDTRGRDEADQPAARTEAFERSGSLEFTFAPRATTVLTFTLKTPGKPYWERPDLGISADDLVVHGRTLSLTVHSLGAVASPPATVGILDSAGRTLLTAPVPALAAPADLLPKTTTLEIQRPDGAAEVVLDPDHALTEITRLNNRVHL